MITVIVPVQLLENLIDNDLDFRITEQKPDEKFIQINFSNNPTDVNKFGNAYYNYGIRIGKSLQKINKQ
jgi:hypothetical protein